MHALELARFIENNKYNVTNILYFSIKSYDLTLSSLSPLKYDHTPMQLPILIMLERILDFEIFKCLKCIRQEDNSRNFVGVGLD